MEREVQKTEEEDDVDVSDSSPKMVSWVEGEQDGEGDSVNLLNGKFGNVNLSWLNLIESDGEEEDGEHPGHNINGEDSQLKEDTLSVQAKPPNCWCVKPGDDKNWFGWLINSSSMATSWLLTLQMRSIHNIVVLYEENLRIFFKPEGVPDDITALFELILKKPEEDRKTEDEMSTQSSTDAEPIDLSKFENISLYGDNIAMLLRDLVRVSLELHLEMVQINRKLHEWIETSGVLLRDSGEQLLGVSFEMQVIQLMKMLNIAVKIFKRDLLHLVTDAEAKEVLKFSSGKWVTKLGKYLNGDIYYSMVNKLEGFTTIACISVARMMSLMCYMAKKKTMLCANHKAKFISVVIYIIRFLEGKLKKMRLVDRRYEDDKYKYPCSEIKNVSYSKANKARRQCNLIINHNEQLKSEVIEQQKLVEELIELENCSQENPQRINDVVDKILQLQERIVKSSNQYQNLVKAQSVLLSDLAQKESCAEIVDECTVNNQPMNSTPQSNLNVNVESSSQESAERSEFSNVEGAEEIVTAEESDRKDEVYMALFKEDDKVEESDENEEFEEKEVEALYTGVVHQLKDVLVPVKSKMMEREKDAVKKVLGDVSVETSSLEELLEKDEKDMIQSPETRSLPLAGQNKMTMHCGVKDDDIDIPCNSGAMMVGMNMMQELKLKLGAGFGVQPEANVEEYEYGDDVSSDSEKESE